MAGNLGTLGYPGICQQTLDAFFRGKVCGKTLIWEIVMTSTKKKRFILLMEEIRLTSWDGKNIPLFKGFHTYWLVSRISEPSTVDESTYNTNGIWCKWRVSWCNCGCYSPCEGIEWNTWSPPLMFLPKHLQVLPPRITDFEKCIKEIGKNGSIHFSLQNSELPLIILVFISIGNHHFLGCPVFRSFVGHCLSCRKMASNVKQTCPLRP